MGSVVLSTENEPAHQLCLGVADTRWMVQRAGLRQRVAAAALPVLVGLLGGAGTSVAAETPPGATTTVVTPNETKILSIETLTTTTTSPAPAPRPATSPTTAPLRARPAAPTATTVASVSPALRALVEASAAERRRLSAEIFDLESRVAGMEADLATAQAAVSPRQTSVGDLELLVARARFDVSQAGGRVTQLDASASAAADALQVQRTTVARPPTPGHTRRDAAAQARQALAAGVEARLQSDRSLTGLETQLDLARQSAGGMASDLEAKDGEIQRARETLAGLRQQLTAAEQSAPVLPAAASSTTDLTVLPNASALASATIPAPYLSLYVRAAATCRGLPWTVLAAVGAVESAHGQSTAAGVQSSANFAGAMGPMQFLAGTWAAYGVDGDGDGVRNVYDPDDAVFGAANYLCVSGAGNVSTLRSALWDYNHADWYVELVLDLAAKL